MDNSKSILDPLKKSRDYSQRNGMFGIVSKSIDKRTVDQNIEKSEILNGKGGTYIDQVRNKVTSSGRKFRNSFYNSDNK